MLGLFKKMLSKTEAAPMAPIVKPVAPPAIAVRKPAMPAPVRVVAAAPNPSRPSAQLPTVTPPPATSTHVQVALAAIASGLPESISHKLPASPDQFVAIPVDRVLPQLAHGMVIMTAAELRECAPESFAALAGNDDLQITLPLGDIVKQLSPEHFARREQKRVEVPAAVTSVFAGGISGVHIAKPTPPQTPQAPRPQPAVTTTAAPKPNAPAPVGAPSKIAMSPQALAAFGEKEHTAAQLGPRATIATGPKAAPAAKPPPAQRSATAPSPKKPSAEVQKITGELAVPLGFVCNEWVDEVRAQLAGVVVAEAQIHVPLGLLQPAMQSGKVLFSWQEVASWIRPPLTIPPTPKVGEMAVEFPLKVVAPLFMAHHRAATQKRVAIDQSIPDLFGGGNSTNSVQAQVAQPSPPAGAVPQDFAPRPAARAAVPASQSPAPIPMSIASPAAPLTELRPASVPAPVVSTGASLEQIVGAVGKRFGIKEIIANAARLPGAAGALLAMNDGLLVTSQTPPSIKAETIAAFLPQMFGRMNQYTKELALGSLQELTLGVEGGQWHVIKCETIYFAVLGKRGEPLPLNLLAQVAAELSSQSN